MSGNWNSWQWSNQRGRQKNTNATKGPGKARREEPKEGKASFPSYDGELVSASAASGSSTAPGTLPENVVDLLQKIAFKDKDMAGEISAVITPEVSEQEQLKAQQRRLNYMRKLQTRIYKKEKLIKDKEASMTKFLLDIKKHVEAEKLRHRQETDLLERELQELREQLQKAKDGKETEEEAPMEDLEEILEDGDAEKLQLKERLHKAEAANVAMQQQLQQFQSQMTAFMQAQQTPSPSVAPPGLTFSPDQAVKTPVIKLDEAIAVARRETRRDPLQPFGVRRSTLRSRTPSGTYTPSPGRPEDGGRNHGQDKLEGMDN